MEYKTTKPEDMENTGREIGKKLKGGEVVLLYGELGSGKTTLVKGISQTIGVKEIATSPTFTLMNVYKANHPKIKNFVHTDTYRLQHKQDLEDVGLNDYLYKKDTLCIIEWPDKVEDYLQKKNTVKVTIEYLNREDRKVTLEEPSPNISFKKN
jgi:tRNA threonylcarbamoyladenosine biosynthesis protein TsaE